MQDRRVHPPQTLKLLATVITALKVALDLTLLGQGQLTVEIEGKNVGVASFHGAAPISPAAYAVLNICRARDRRMRTASAEIPRI